MQKIYQFKQESLATLLEEVETSKVVFTNGCFDILHLGHARYLQEARALGDCLVLGLNTDSSVKRLKGPQRPINGQVDRAELLLHLRWVDYVVLFDEETPLELIQSISPEVLVKGGDWAVEDIVGSDFVLNNGGEVRSLQLVAGKSSTNIIEKAQLK